MNIPQLEYSQDGDEWFMADMSKLAKEMDRVRKGEDCPRLVSTYIGLLGGSIVVSSCGQFWRIKR